MAKNGAVKNGAENGVGNRAENGAKNEIKNGMRRLALIPAKHNSSRLKNKNILLFAGKPMLVHTIEAALESRLFDSVLVSTSDDAIMAIAQGAGAEIHRRDEKMNHDPYQLAEIALAVLEDEAREGREYDLLSVLLATAPLRTSIDIQKTVALVEKNRSGAALAVTRYQQSPFKALKTGIDNRVTPLWPDYISLATQETPDCRIDNGSTYAIMTALFLEAKTLLPEELYFHDMPIERSVDIDTKDDWDRLIYYAKTSGLDEAQ